MCKRNAIRWVLSIGMSMWLVACGDMHVDIRGRSDSDLRRDPSYSLHFLLESTREYFQYPSLDRIDEMNTQLQMVSDVIYQNTGRSFPFPATLQHAIDDGSIYPGHVDATRVSDEILIANGDVNIQSGDGTLVIALGTVNWTFLGEDNIIIARDGIYVDYGDRYGLSLALTENGIIHMPSAEETYFYTQGSYDVDYGGNPVPYFSFAVY